jgi:L-threonylcarbamoyladenylate synthase
MDIERITDVILSGGIVVLPTDTLYGICASALDVDAVSKVYEIKDRDPAKPLIVLIAEMEDIERFGVILSDDLRTILSSYWPGPYSLLLPTIDDTYEYLHRGTGRIAFRIPDIEELRNLLRSSGPLVAPSANKEGEPPAETMESAKRVFGDDVSYYEQGGTKSGPASSLIAIEEDGSVQVLR